MLLGLAAGKVGDLVFYRDGGEQRTRTRVVPKNPRSPRQMAQRVKLANVVNVFRQLQSIISDAFPTRPSNQSGYNAFAKNAIVVSPFMQKIDASQGMVIPAPYVISRGTIDALPYVVSESGEIASISLPIASLTTSDATIASVSSLMLQAYPTLQNGDELHFVMMEIDMSSSEGDFAAGKPITRVASFTIDTTNSSSLAVAGLQVQTGSLIMPITLSVPHFCGGVVVSRVDGSGKLQVSTSQLAMSDEAAAQYGRCTSEDAMLSAIDSYGVGEQSILRD